MRNNVISENTKYVKQEGFKHDENGTIVGENNCVIERPMTEEEKLKKENEMLMKCIEELKGELKNKEVCIVQLQRKISAIEYILNPYGGTF